jgi:hypothetical protein
MGRPTRPRSGIGLVVVFAFALGPLGAAGADNIVIDEALSNVIDDETRRDFYLNHWVYVRNLSFRASGNPLGVCAESRLPSLEQADYWCSDRRSSITTDEGPVARAAEACPSFPATMNGGGAGRRSKAATPPPSL